MRLRQGQATLFGNPNHTIYTRGDGRVAGAESPVEQRVSGFLGGYVAVFLCLGD